MKTRINLMKDGYDLFWLKLSDISYQLEKMSATASGDSNTLRRSKTSTAWNYDLNVCFQVYHRSDWANMSLDLLACRILQSLLMLTTVCLCFYTFVRHNLGEPIHCFSYHWHLTFKSEKAYRLPSSTINTDLSEIVRLDTSGFHDSKLIQSISVSL